MEESDFNGPIWQWFSEERVKICTHSYIGNLSESNIWHNRDTCIGRLDNKFHRGVLVKSLEGAKVVDRFMIQSTSMGNIHGMMILGSYRGRFLIQAKAEPGNRTPGRVVVTTTLQASLENLRNNKIPYSELQSRSSYANSVDVPQDAAMLYEKVNRISCIELIDLPVIHEHFYLATRSEIFLLAHEGLVSEHLMQALGYWALVMNS
jgi:hypothetical protein